VVDLDESLSRLLSERSEPKGLIREVVYSPQDIKGLDRRTVLVWSLGKTIGEYEKHCDQSGARQLQIRHIIGAIRVALGRATETLVILEQDGSEHLEAVKLHEIDGVRVEDFAGLLEELQQEEYSYEERIAGFLQEAREAMDRDDLDRASERVKRAESLVQGVDDAYLEDRVGELRRRIRRRVVEPILRKAAGHLSRGEFREALRANQRARDALLPTDSADLKKKVSKQHEEIQRAPVERAMEQAEEQLAAKQLDGALEANSRAESLAKKLGESFLLNQVHQQQIRIKRTPVEDALGEADRYRRQGAFQKALESNEYARQWSDRFGDSALEDRIQHQHRAIRRGLIDGILSQAEEQFYEGDIEVAFATVERAQEALAPTDEDSLRERVREQDQTMRQLAVDDLYEQAEEDLATSELERALEKNHQAQALLEASDDSSGLADERLASLRDQEARIDRGLGTRRGVQETRDEVEELLGNDRLLEAYDTWREARRLSIEADEPELERITQEFWRDRDKDLSRIASECWKEGRNNRDSKNWSDAARAYEMAADIRRYQAEDPGADSASRQDRRVRARALDCLAERYQQLPPPAQEEVQIVHLIDLITRYVICLKETGAIGKSAAVCFVEEWIEEAERGLGEGGAHNLSEAEEAPVVAEWRGSDLQADYPDLGPKAVEAATEPSLAGESGSAKALIELVKDHFPGALGNR
jgi:hypothetical protein